MQNLGGPTGNPPPVTPLTVSDHPIHVPPKDASFTLKVVVTIAKVAALVLGLILLAACLIPLVLVEIGVRGYLIFTQTPNSKPRILLLAAKEDPLCQKTVSFALNQAKRRLYTEYEIDMHVVASIEDINQKLAQGSNVAAVWMIAHGNPTEIHLYPKKNQATKKWEGILSIQNVHQLKFSFLPAGIPIILDACQTGSHAAPLSIAQAVAHIAKNHPVFAPTNMVTEFNAVMVSKKGTPLQIEWRRPCFAKTDHPIDLAVGSVWSILLSILPSSLVLHQNITHKIFKQLSCNPIE